MSTQTIHPKELEFTNYQTYLWSMFFVGVSVLAPAVFHAFGVAGQVFLPIYFLVLLSSLMFGWRVGLAVAVFSPLANFSFLAMPALPILPYVIFKGTVLALIILLVEKIKINKFVGLILALLVYQLIGFLVIMVFAHNFKLASMDLMAGYPGLLAQLVLVILFSVKFYEQQDNGGNLK